MIDVPVVIDKESFQEAWISAASHLRTNSWTTRNLVVQIAEPSTMAAMAFPQRAGIQ